MKRYVLPALFAGAIASSGSAATLTATYDFTANTPGAPTPVHQGSFSYTYDSVLGGGTLTSIDFSIGSTTFTLANTTLQTIGGNAFNYDLFGSLNGLEVIAGTDDFFLRFDTPNFLTNQFGYSEVGANGVFFGLFTQVVITPRAAPAVPESSTWAMMLIGFCFVGGVIRYSRRRANIRFDYT